MISMEASGDKKRCSLCDNSHEGSKTRTVVGFCQHIKIDAIEPQ